ncbi:hypothetical protein [Chenggangzhangella methanolivorans]|uniref:ASCH domain-containing protein n=1 Tax=Chenggangzhangella methanolivorans TaxID=1437009 RepID=A0A9E6R9W7_9HYPH|nr:hypothetical protein [Chenggangzhangella methanolivorans]QZN99498.1 hypothetical protein K6K41_22760 [Chenggangzhangella methanolivorans]
MTNLPALTVWQPWASLIAIGAKPYEFRGWRAPRAYQGRRIAIHAAARPVRIAEVVEMIEDLTSDRAWTTCLDAKLALPVLERVYRDPKILPLSAVVCTAMLGVPRHGDDIAAEFGGPVNDSDRHDHAHWGWPLTDVFVLEPPAPARGAQGFWTWTDVRLA